MTSLQTKLQTLAQITDLPVSCYFRGDIKYFVFGPRHQPIKTVCTYRKAKVFAEGFALGKKYK
jgi:hypothetical protein